MDSIEIENIEKLLHELEETSNLLLIDEGGSPKQLKFNKDLEKKQKSDKNLLASYEFLSSYDFRDTGNTMNNTVFLFNYFFNV